MTRPREFSAFLLVAGSAAALNLTSRALYSLALPFEVAVPLAYATGMVYAFLMYRRFVFGRSGRRLDQEIRGFLLVQAASFTQVWIVSTWLLDHVVPPIPIAHAQEAVAHLLGVISPVLVSYYGHKLIAFRRIGVASVTASARALP